ncbi:hypothetical protein VIGAN_08249200 [Vigna angularis var. angularis]|uniref:Secreted protein n=1 Tax=Vigna angularis var. angularis TaxID=157739 RepID=A0A0S3SSC3_PHAAN|nr:hypothetical protein VIGAN_08249200 [Vigna angularis var. angularis]
MLLLSFSFLHPPPLDATCFKLAGRVSYWTLNKALRGCVLLLLEGFFFGHHPLLLDAPPSCCAGSRTCCCCFFKSCWTVEHLLIEKEISASSKRAISCCRVCFFTCWMGSLFFIFHPRASS